MTFILYSKEKNTLTIAKGRVNFSKNFFEKCLKDSKFVSISFDKENEAVLIANHDGGDTSSSFPVHIGEKSNYFLSCSIHKFMPLGKYVFTEEMKGGFVLKKLTK